MAPGELEVTRAVDTALQHRQCPALGHTWLAQVLWDVPWGRQTWGACPGLLGTSRHRPSLGLLVMGLWDMGYCWGLPLSSRGHTTFPQDTRGLGMA